MTTTEQLPFDLNYRPSYRRDDFLTSPSNQEARTWIDKWPDWPSFALIIQGAQSCGKTHLLHIWAEQAQATVVQSSTLSSDTEVEDILKSTKRIAVDNIDRIFGHQKAEENLFHIYNLLKEERGSLLLSSTQRQADWQIELQDLSSRLKSVMAVGMEQPDDMLLSAVLMKLFSDRQLHLQEGVLNYLLPRVERSMAFINDLVAQIDKRALVEKRPISISLVREVLEKS